MAATDYEIVAEYLIEIKCPIGGTADCYGWMERPELREHLEKRHPGESTDVEEWFQLQVEKIVEAHRTYTEEWKANRGKRSF